MRNLFGVISILCGLFGILAFASRPRNVVYPPRPRF
jgi:hypothetical protein